MDTSLLSGSVWLSLSKETRAKIANLFGITKSGGVEVRNGPQGAQIISDGYTYQDLSAITIERMEELTDSKSDNFYFLFKKIVKLVNDEVPEEDKVPEEFGEVTEDSPTVIVSESTEKKKFCEHCSSKGVRHMKNCTREQHENKTT